MKTDIILEIKWTKQDVIHILDEEGIPATDENVNKIISADNLKRLQERSIQCGWDELYDIVRDTF